MSECEGSPVLRFSKRTRDIDVHRIAMYASTVFPSAAGIFPSFALRGAAKGGISYASLLGRVLHSVGLAHGIHGGGSLHRTQCSLPAKNIPEY